jgi:pyroglutamyl-peptidase
MSNVLITAFEPYDRWQSNSSWLSVIELTKERPAEPKITTRLYPVDFRAAKAKLHEDLQANYDFALHLGQAPGAANVRLEAIGLNVGGSSQQLPEEFQPLAVDGPAAYQSVLPLGRWAGLMRRAGIPAQVSYHAGTYLCNATLYLSHYFTQQLGLKTRSCFVHLPLSTSQAISERQDIASMPTPMAALALRLILNDLATGEV